MRRMLWIVAVLWGTARFVLAAEPPISDLGVDLVAVKRGPRLLGAIVDRTADDTTIAVSREWLRTAHPRYSEECVAAEFRARKQALETLSERLAIWKDERREPPPLAFFLKKESEHVAAELGKKEGAEGEPAGADFLLITIPATQVERTFVQPAQRKQVAVVAWRERLSRVEQRTAASLLHELEKQKIDVQNQHVDLADRLPIRAQGDDEWLARQAIVEYQLRRPFDFQGTGDLLVRTGEGAAAAEEGALLLSLLRSQIEGTLAELLNDTGTPPGKPKSDGDAGLKRAMAMAGADDARGFRVTRVAPDASTGRVRVEARFVARLSAGKWATVWNHVEEADASKVDSDEVDRIAADPQVKQALKVVESTGLGDAGALRQALRIGAATKQAQEKANARFLEFRDRYLQHLDRPLLPLPH